MDSCVIINVLLFLSSNLIYGRLERRRRDLNPRAAINDLLPFQGSPFGQLGYFSKLASYKEKQFFFMSLGEDPSGEGGIRTHAPVKANGFQDRLVMTASIPLRIGALFTGAFGIISNMGICVNHFF